MTAVATMVTPFIQDEKEVIKAEKFWGRIHLAISLVGRSPLSLENKVILYKQVLRPVITYGSPVWGAATATHMKKIQLYECLVLLNQGQVTRTTPQLAPPSPNFHTTPTGGGLSSRRASLPYTAGLQWYWTRTHDTPATSSVTLTTRLPRPHNSMANL
ncbi:hypothetical protein TNCV_227551 [Trichonephila clavipes]|nr:hypothetical protein TNCV_227551 [Trichonephila clavipes]